MSKTIKEERLRWVLPIERREIKLVDVAKLCPYGKRSLERWAAAYKKQKLAQKKMSLRRCEKIAPKAQVFKKDKPSKLQGSELPRRADANDAVAVAAPVVDAQAVLVEVADTRDAASIGRRGLHCAFGAGRPL